MRKHLSLLLITSMFIPFLARAEWIPLNKKNSSPTPPNVTLVSDDNYSTVFKIEIAGFSLKDLATDGKNYQIADLMTETSTINPGYPEVPYLAKVLAIPDQAGISVEVLAMGEVQTFSNIYLPPARESWVEGSPETPYTENTDVYNSLSKWPEEFVQTEPPSVFRDFRIARVSVYPMRYIPSKKQLEVVSSITVRVNYGPGEVINPKITAKKPIAPSFGKIYKSFIFNYQSVLDNLYGGKEDGHDLMLCIMPDAFYTSFLPYAEWKRKSGIDIHITKFSDIGANASDPNIIKTHIADAYHNWEVPPTYVLIVGDDGVFPKHNSSYGFPDEDFFVEIDGNDFFPEMMIGRLTNESDYGMQVMLNKFLLYEQTPYTTSTDWFKKGICCSNNAYVSQIETKRFATQRMLVDGGFTSVDTMMSKSPCQYGISDVINAINEGRSWLNYRGEGWSSGWWASCTPVHTSDLAGINNGQKFTFVTSIGCGVAMFHSSGGNCFGEEWMEMGTLSNPKGAAAFIGPTGNTHTAYNNNIDRGIYVGMFQEGMETPGQALVRGKLYMYNVFGNDYYVDYHYKIFCILGDPSIHIWKDVPQAVTVNYSEAIPIGSNTVEFTVTHTATGEPVANAQVCVTGNSIFSTGITDETGEALVDVATTDLETLTVVVRGGSVIPFQGTLVVIEPDGPYVMKDSFDIDDETGGNGNGLLDYGETNLLNLTMKNVGAQAAEDVMVTLSTQNIFITLTDSTANYGTIASGSTSIVTDGFSYTVSNAIPDLDEVLFAITATSGAYTWVSYISIDAHAPVLDYVDYNLSDPTGNNNGKLDPGETADITLTIENTGSAGAMNVLGNLTENDPFITINPTQVNFGNVDGGEQSEAVFSVTANENTPAGHLANLMLSLNADLGITGTGEFGFIIGQVPVLILDMDENGNSAPGMESALNTMDVTYDILPAFPPDLNLYSTIFLCLGIYPNNHVLTSSQGQTLANYLNDGGSLYMEGGDTWYFDPDTPVHAMFNISATGDGTSDMGTVVGQDGTFTEGMSFNYTGDNGWMDHIEPISPAFKIFQNQSPSYGTGVAYDAGTYRTIGTSHEFGGLQDGASPSTKAELMNAYLQFLGVSVTLQSSFSSSTTEVCENNSIDFYDQSTGNASLWIWIFYGGTPSTSTLQNPTVLYSTAGVYDVTLIVSNGGESDTLTLNDYVSVITTPVAPPTPTGPVAVCGNITSSPYNTSGISGITDYEWLLEPSEAGEVSGVGSSTIVTWTDGFLGDVTLKVAGHNDCGTGDYSDPINIVRYMPTVLLAPFDTACIEWSAFELTGGTPPGGEYSGDGIDNGWFDPAVAGLGEHTVTYTFTDPLGCENFATQTIFVDLCTGINDKTDLSGIRIYPNPTSGIITIDFGQNTGAVEIAVVNTLNKIVYSGSLKTMNGKKMNIDLSDLSKGIYFIRLKTDRSDETSKVIIQ